MKNRLSLAIVVWGLSSLPALALDPNGAYCGLMPCFRTETPVGPYVRPAGSEWVSAKSLLECRAAEALKERLPPGLTRCIPDR